MTNSKKLLGALLLSATMAMSACVKDATGQIAVDNDKTASKLVFTSENAVGGELLVYFEDEAATRVEAGVSRSGATRSGIDEFDAVLDNIGIQSMQRLFPVDMRNEERTRAAGLHRWYIVKFDAETDLDEAARAMAKVAEVEHVEFNQQLMNVHSGEIIPVDADEIVATAQAQTRAAVEFNDPQLSRQWHYINTGNTSISSYIKAGADVNCAEAWKICTGDPRIIVAVVDNCVQWDHPDLAANMWVNEREKSGSSDVDDDGNGYKDDVHGFNFVTNTPLTLSTKGKAPEHGTHVAGTVAAVNNNGVGGCGIAGGSGKNDGVRIMSCQIFYEEGGGTAAISAKAIKYAADNGAVIIQASYGYDAGSITSDSQYAAGVSVEKQAIDYFINTKNCDAVDGGIVIFAAGNDSAQIAGYPGAYRDYISVSAMACNFAPASYTNCGPGCNVAAPGGEYSQGVTAMVYSTINNNSYGYSQGTSMACPHMSGVAALGLSYALQIGKKLTRNEYNTILLTSVNDINRYCGDTKYNGKMGTGYIDAFQVLMNVRGITCIPVATGSQQTIDIQQYIGSGDLGLSISGIEMSEEDLARLGMTSKPTVFGKRILIKCANTGSAIMKVKLVGGSSNTSGMNGMTITKEFAIIARDRHATSGGWL